MMEHYASNHGKAGVFGRSKQLMVTQRGLEFQQILVALSESIKLARPQEQRTSLMCINNSLHWQGTAEVKAYVEQFRWHDTK